MSREERTYWERVTRRPYSRRGVLKGMGVVGVGGATAALIGCGDDDDDDDDDDDGNGNGGSPTATATSAPQATPTPEPSTIKRGGQLVIPMGGSPRSLDFHFDTFPYNTWITTNTNNGLLKFTPDFSEIVTDLAASLPEQPDDLTFTLKVRQGVEWQDIPPVNGRLFTAQDVKWSIERQMTDEAGKFQHAYFFLGAVASIDTPDDETVVFNMNKPYAPMISYLASPWTLMANRETVDMYGDLTEHAVGTGPFIFKEWQKDVKFELVKNPNYWKAGLDGDPLPYVDGISVLISTDPDTTATLFIDRKVHGVIVGQTQLDRTKNARSDATYQTVPTQFWRQFRMQPTTEDNPYKPPFDDPRVRQAIVKAIDDEAVLQFVYRGDGLITHGPILPIYEKWALKETPEGARTDRAAAKALMEQAGNPKIDAPMIWAQNATADQIGEVIKQQLAEIGVTVQLQGMELAAYYNQTYSYDYTFSHHQPLNNPDPDENLSSYFGRKSAFFKHYNPDIWDMIDQQASELDEEKRIELVHDTSVKIVEDYPMRFMFTTNNHEFTDPAVKNWFFHTDLYDGRMEDLYLDA